MNRGKKFVETISVHVKTVFEKKIEKQQDDRDMIEIFNENVAKESAMQKEEEKQKEIQNQVMFTNEECMDFVISTQEMSNTKTTKCFEVEGSQGVGKKRKSLNQSTQKQVRKSARLALNPRIGPKLVSEIDLTKDSEPSDLHAGIIKPRQPVYQGYLPKGTFVRGDKLYTSASALAAEVEWEKKNKQISRVN